MMTSYYSYVLVAYETGPFLLSGGGGGGVEKAMPKALFINDQRIVIQG